jgi:signal transduction histidine kinase
MNRDEAIKMLLSTSPHDRLRAARFFARNTHVRDLAMLRQARRLEVVSYVKTSLDLAIARHSDLEILAEPDPADEYDVPEDVKKQIRGQAVEWISGLLLHEIASPMGLVKLSASREVPNYDVSKTKHYLQTVERIFEAIEQLKGAAAVPKPERFDLAELLKEIIATESTKHPIPVSPHGPQPLLITSDPTLIRLSICNGLRNALESVSTVGTGDPHPIIITWGETDVDYWVSVMDKGPGMVGPIESAFEIGKTTKQGHSGFGLAIARQAIETLGGSVSLLPAAEGGARYEVRWERQP